MFRRGETITSGQTDIVSVWTTQVCLVLAVRGWEGLGLGLDLLGRTSGGGVAAQEAGTGRTETEIESGIGSGIGIGIGNVIEIGIESGAGSEIVLVVEGARGEEIGMRRSGGEMGIVVDTLIQWLTTPFEVSKVWIARHGYAMAGECSDSELLRLYAAIRTPSTP